MSSSSAENKTRCDINEKKITLEKTPYSGVFTKETILKVGLDGWKDMDITRITPGLFLHGEPPLASRSFVPTFSTIGFVAAYTILFPPKWARNSFI